MVRKSLEYTDQLTIYDLRNISIRGARILADGDGCTVSNGFNAPAMIEATMLAVMIAKSAVEAELKMLRCFRPVEQP